MDNHDLTTTTITGIILCHKPKAERDLTPSPTLRQTQWPPQSGKANAICIVLFSAWTTALWYEEEVVINYYHLLFMSSSAWHQVLNSAQMLLFLHLTSAYTSFIPSPLHYSSSHIRVAELLCPPLSLQGSYPEAPTATLCLFNMGSQECEAVQRRLPVLASQDLQ